MWTVLVTVLYLQTGTYVVSLKAEFYPSKVACEAAMAQDLDGLETILTAPALVGAACVTKEQADEVRERARNLEDPMKRPGSPHQKGRTIERRAVGLENIELAAKRQAARLQSANRPVRMEPQSGTHTEQNTSKTGTLRVPKG